MTLPISGVSGLGSLGKLADLGIRAPQSTNTGKDFGAQVVDALNNLNQTHSNADALAQQAMTGDINDVQDYTIAAAKASVATELTVAIRNRAIDAFSEIMRMPI